MADETPRTKKRKFDNGDEAVQKLVGSPLLRTPHKILGEVRAAAAEDTQNEGESLKQSSKAIQALCSCVVAMANDDDPEDAKNVLKSLLDEKIDPNYVDEDIIRKVGGSPLYLAAKLDVPTAASLLLKAGASLVQGNEEETPIEAAIRLDHAGVCQIMFDHIENMEMKVFEPAKK
mmetsp:Transcript_28535/g.37337  ORF Transcript_28535/g.37337 Transcript_28535/m.37337 type:complete len:175 (+) Transcript_28535:151-675(+)|eukprot:CAMPEP_0117759384 /NCGR_PEP_ID=MMETSP0947-20121206/15979_1 /TAXON_ID=44440 /ORGANISM="Chattonella subsalsa, Strain CCMP2191" /LENGTH=174 /DNA_ID=CAMNT_0005579827 /DNA_START=145 /DNA_END=669 /DNA_ORIENTATION=-